MAEQPKFSYGGQAVIEGVMIRGRDHYSLAVRRQDGNITHLHEPLNTLFTGRIRRIPVLSAWRMVAFTHSNFGSYVRGLFAPGITISLKST